MKIHNTEKIEIIRLTISTDKSLKNNKQTEYLNIVEAKHEDVVKYLQNLFKENTVKKGDKSTIDARYSYCGKNGKSIRLSLFDIGAKEIKEKIITDLGHKNLTK
jgi:hypothetical protein